MTKRGNIDIVRVNGDIFVEQGEKEGVKKFVGDVR